MTDIELGAGVYYRDPQNSKDNRERLFVTQSIGINALCAAIKESPAADKEALISACKHTQPETVKLLLNGGMLSTNGEHLSFDLDEAIAKASISYEWAKVGIERMQQSRGFVEMNNLWLSLAGMLTNPHKMKSFLIHPSLRERLSVTSHFNQIIYHMTLRIQHDNLEKGFLERGSIRTPDGEPSVMRAFTGLADMHLAAEGIAESPLSPKDIARVAVIDILGVKR